MSKSNDEDKGNIRPDLIPGKTRILDSDGFVATVLYVGTVASAKNSSEVYVGVEWDDHTRGKHDDSQHCKQKLLDPHQGMPLFIIWTEMPYFEQQHERTHLLHNLLFLSGASHPPNTSSYRL